MIKVNANLSLTVNLWIVDRVKVKTSPTVNIGVIKREVKAKTPPTVNT